MERKLQITSIICLVLIFYNLNNLKFVVPEFNLSSSDLILLSDAVRECGYLLIDINATTSLHLSIAQHSYVGLYDWILLIICSWGTENVEQERKTCFPINRLHLDDITLDLRLTVMRGKQNYLNHDCFAWASGGWTGYRLSRKKM